MKSFVLIFLQLSILLLALLVVSIAIFFVIEFEFDCCFIVIYLLSFYTFVLTFGFFLCRLLVNRRDDIEVGIGVRINIWTPR